MNKTGLDLNGAGPSSFVSPSSKLSAKPKGRRPMGQGITGGVSNVAPKRPFGDVFGTLNKLSSHNPAHGQIPLVLTITGLTAYREGNKLFKLASLILKVHRGAAVDPVGVSKYASWNPYDLISEKTYENRGHQLTSPLAAFNSFPKEWLGMDFFPDSQKLTHQLNMNKAIADGEATIHDYHRYVPKGEDTGVWNNIARKVDALPPLALARGVWGAALNAPLLGLRRDTADSIATGLSYFGRPDKLVTGIPSMLKGIGGAFKSIPSAIRSAPSALRAISSAPIAKTVGSAWAAMKPEAYTFLDTFIRSKLGDTASFFQGRDNQLKDTYRNVK